MFHGRNHTIVIESIFWHFILSLPANDGDSDHRRRSKSRAHNGSHECPSSRMNCTEEVTVELASDGMIVHRPTSADVETEYYVIRDANLYTDDRNRGFGPVPLSRLWLIWFGSLPLLAAVIYLIVQVFGL